MCVPLTVKDLLANVFVEKQGTTVKTAVARCIESSFKIYHTKQDYEAR